jgi:hypothetical protein
MSQAHLDQQLEDFHLDFAWKTHDYIHNYIRFADTKATFVVAWCSALLGTLYVARLHESVVHARFTSSDVSWPTTLAALALPLLAASFLTAAWSIIPRLPTNQRAGLVFWESIFVHADGDLYANVLSRESRGQLARHLCVQIYMVAGVARRKYLYVTVSMWFGFFGTILGVLAVLLNPLPTLG